MDEYVSNLTQLADYYRTRGKQQKFCAAVRSMSDAAAAHVDMQMVAKMLHAYRSLWEIKGQVAAETYSFSRGGTCANAIMFYARLTRPRSGARGAVDLAPYLPADLLDDHNHIHDLRDEAIAHLGAGKRPGRDKWSDGALVAHVSKGDASLSYQSSRALSETTVVKRLEKLAPVAEQLLFDVAMRRGDIVLPMFVEFRNNNQAFKKGTKEMIFVAEDMYQGGVALAKAALNGQAFLVNQNGPNATPLAIQLQHKRMTRSRED